MSPVLETLDDLAEHFGRCRRTMQRWRAAGMPRTADGWDTHQVEAWLRTARYLGSSLRQLEQETLAGQLYEKAVLQLRHGLETFVQAYLKARGRNRTLILDRCCRDLLRTMQQEWLLKGEGGGGSNFETLGEEKGE